MYTVYTHINSLPLYIEMHSLHNERSLSNAITLLQFNEVFLISKTALESS